MNWSGITTVFLFGTVKFLFSPATGPAVGLTPYETFFANLAGGLLSMTIFYFAAEKLLKSSHNKKVAKNKQLIAAGKSPIIKNSFTKRNKIIIRVKKKIGMLAFCFYVPLFLSIPVGSMITAKFYGKRKATFPLMVLGAIINNFIIVALVYGASSIF